MIWQNALCRLYAHLLPTSRHPDEKLSTVSGGASFGLSCLFLRTGNLQTHRRSHRIAIDSREKNVWRSRYRDANPTISSGTLVVRARTHTMNPSTPKGLGTCGEKAPPVAPLSSYKRLSEAERAAQRTKAANRYRNMTIEEKKRVCARQRTYQKNYQKGKRDGTFVPKSLRGYIPQALSQKRWSRGPGGRFLSTKLGAKKRGIEFCLTDAQVKDMLKGLKCTYCEAPPPAIGCHGIDRVDNRQGYTWENSVACCSSCNHSKSNRDLEQWILQCVNVAVFCPLPNDAKRSTDSSASNSDDSGASLALGFRLPLQHDHLDQQHSGCYSSYRNNALTRGREFELTSDEFYSLVRGQLCHYCGYNPAPESIGKGRAPSRTAKHVGLDRVINSEGYTLQNVVPCCAWCNRMKGTSSYKEFIESCHSIAKRWGAFFARTNVSPVGVEKSDSERLRKQAEELCAKAVEYRARASDFQAQADELQERAVGLLGDVHPLGLGCYFSLEDVLEMIRTSKRLEIKDLGACSRQSQGE